MRQRNKKWALPYLNENEFCIVNNVEPFTHVDVKENACLEIGTGKGDFIVDMAMKNADNIYYGIDGQKTILAIAAKKIEEQEIKNVNLILMVAQDLRKVFDKEVFDNIYLNFSDPWPKARHEKRRLTSPKLLNEIDYVLKSNGLLIMKTDNLDLFNYSISSIEQFGYNVEVVDYDYKFDESHDSMSEYERKFREKGNKIYRLVARKEGK